MLIVALDTSKKEPLYEQIYNSIKEEIITGVLPFGARLPSARRLSKHLDVSRNTVDTAYAQLCAEGYIESKPKRGFFVCQVEELAELHIPVKIEEEEEEIRPEKIPYDFSSAGVDMEQFPYHIWRKLLKEIMINDNMEWECPQCHNKDHAKMNVTRRTCGYLGENFWNAGKTKEIKEEFFICNVQIVQGKEMSYELCNDQENRCGKRSRCESVAVRQRLYPSL